MPASSTLTPRTSSSAVGTRTITTPEPQFDSVAVAVPSRKGSSRVTGGGDQRLAAPHPPPDRHEEQAPDRRDRRWSPR